MRKILFRGKRKDNGKWIYGFPVFDFADCSLKRNEKCACEHNGELLCFYGWIDELHEYDEVEVGPETVCQYTGLTDKNGRKIFEGDILKRVLLPTKRIKNDFRIAFVSANSCFSAIDLDGSNVTFISDYINNRYEIEVIGNIFDNSELIGGANE